MSDVNDNLKKLFNEISKGNDFGEKITLLGATKYVPIDRVNEAIGLGLNVIGENHAQEFRDKSPFYLPCEKHFIGTLQQNKLKYLVGKADVIDSVTSLSIAEEINLKAEKLGLVQNVMIEINAGDEISKTGISINEAKPLYKSIIKLNNIKLVGIMAMLPNSQNTVFCERLFKDLRMFFDDLRAETPSIKTLSAGMSGDYKIAIENGSNMIRLGRAIFGERETH